MPRMRFIRILPDPRAVFLGGDGLRIKCFFLRLPSAQSLFCAPHIGLVDLHATAEPFSAGPQTIARRSLCSNAQAVR